MLKIMCDELGIKKGSQICIQYGKYSNRHLLSQYGFALKDNKYDYYALRLEINEMYSKRNQILTQTAEKEYFEFKLKRNLLSESLLLFIRALTWEINRHELDFFFLAGDQELDRAIFLCYKNLLIKELEGFSTSIEEDEKLLNENIPYKLYFSVFFI